MEIDNKNDKQKLLRVYMDILSKEYGSNLSHKDIIVLMKEQFNFEVDTHDLLVYAESMIQIDIEDMEQQISNLGLKYE